jgi:DNA-binding NarL/FixJ family response regulator
VARGVNVVGPHGLTREVTIQALTESGIGVTGVAGEGLGATREVAVLVDPDPTHWDVIDLTGPGVVVVSGCHLDDAAVVEAVRRGADAVLDANCDPGLVVVAVTVVANGGTLLGPSQTRALAEALRHVARPAEEVVGLTKREVDILTSIDRGESVKQTARALGISLKTVENLQSRMFRKLGARNRAQAVAKVHALGLLPAAP